ncbi:MAG: two-component regulator propeller domain-containing protein [Bacteroidota bacterium]
MIRLNDHIRLVIIFLLLITDFQVSVAQPKQLQFKYLTPRDGLSSSAVTAILQDHKGFMWIGTYNGLNRYDGYHFKIYRNDPTDSTSLPGDLVRAILEDRNHNVLIGSNSGLSLFDWAHDRFINYRFEQSSPLYGISCNIYQITEDSIGNLFLASDIGLIYFDRINNTVVQYTHDPDNPESLGNNWVERVLVDSQNRTWVSTRGGLDLFHPSTGTFSHVTHGENVTDDYSGVAFISIAEDHGGNIWIGSANGIYCLKNSSASHEPVLTRYYHYPDDPYSFNGNRLLSLYVDHEDNLWAGAENGGLFLYDRGSQRFWQYKSDEYDPASLNNESIQCIFMDNTENLWIGTFGGGLNISQKNSSAITNYTNLKGGEQSLSNNLVSSFLLDHDGQIWIGTDGGGLNLFNEYTKRFTRYNMSNSGLSSNVILTMVEDHDNTIWMGTWGGGLVSFNHERNRFKSYSSQNSKIPGNEIFSIAMGTDNDLWMGSFTMGLIHYQIDNNEFTSYTQSNSAIVNNYVFVVKTDMKGQVYLGTSGGMQIFSPGDNRFVTFLPDQNNRNTISNGVIYDILIDNDTCVWVATQSGLNRFNPETRVFTRYYKEDGLPDNVIKSLLKEGAGILWVGTNMGICRFNLQNNHYDTYTQDDGLQSNEFNYKSTLLLKNGNLLFGGTNGFNSISPDRIKTTTAIPKILITDFLLFNKSVNANTDKSPLKTHISDCRELVLRYNQTVLTFYFTAMDFTMPEKNQYAYMLENFDDDWTYSGNRRDVTYTNLDPGSYVLRVKGSNNDGVWNEEGTSLQITILPPWWLSWYWKAFTIIAALALIIAFFYIRTSTLRKQKERLRLKVEERTRDLEKINVELATAISTKDKFFSIIAHDLRSPFNSFLGLTQIMSEELPTLTMEQIQKLAMSMQESAISLFNLLENLLQWAKIQQGIFSFELEKVELVPIVEDCISMVMASAKNKGIELNYDVPDNLAVYVDSNVLQMVIRNLLSNALKYTNKGGKVMLSAKTADPDFVEISIKDTGIGMSDALSKNIFRIDVKTNRNGTAGEPSTGLGLTLCKDFIEKQGGKLWFESQEGVGSTFCFTLPMAGEDSDE